MIVFISPSTEFECGRVGEFRLWTFGDTILIGETLSNVIQVVPVMIPTPYGPL